MKTTMCRITAVLLLITFIPLLSSCSFFTDKKLSEESPASSGVPTAPGTMPDTPEDGREKTGAEDETPDIAATAYTQTPEKPDVPDEEIMSKVGSALLLDAATMTVMYSENENARYSPGIFARLMTAVVSLGLLEGRYEETVIVPSQAVKSVTGERMELKNGEEISVEALLYGLIIYNAEDAARTLAIYTAGSLDGFVSLMNEKAKSLGMDNTHFTSPDSASESNDAYITASDAAKLAKEAYLSPEYRRICTETTYSLSGRSTVTRLYTRNYFLSKLILPYYYTDTMGINGLMLGYTDRSKGCGATTARLGERDYICIVMGCEKAGNSEMYNFIASEELLSWGKNRFEMKSILGKDQVFGEISVLLSRTCDYVLAVPESSLSLWLPVSEKDKDLVEYVPRLWYGTLSAPVKEGEAVGEVEVIYKGESVGTVRLVTMQDVPISQGELRKRDAVGFLLSRPFICSVLAVALLSLAGVLVKARILYVKKKEKK